MLLFFHIFGQNIISIFGQIMPNMWDIWILDKQFDMGYNPENWEYLYIVVWRHYERHI
jgi:hypothetical protein